MQSQGSCLYRGRTWLLVQQVSAARPTQHCVVCDSLGWGRGPPAARMDEVTDVGGQELGPAGTVQTPLQIDPTPQQGAGYLPTKFLRPV